eukprot:1257838-Prymnesium_polylepis.1
MRPVSADTVTQSDTGRSENCHADVGSQPALTSDVVETSVAKAMIAEAMCMLDEAQEREPGSLTNVQACGKVVRSS